MGMDVDVGDGGLLSLVTVARIGKDDEGRGRIEGDDGGVESQYVRSASWKTSAVTSSIL